MSNATRYLQKALLDHTLGLSTFTMPVAVYMGLSTSDPGEDGSTNGEPTGSSYARVELTSKMAATVLATGVATNTAVISFAPASGVGWGTVAWWIVTDALSGGNVLFYGSLLSPMTVNSGDAPIFAEGVFILTASSGTDSDLTRYLAKKWLDHALGLASFTAPSGVYLALLASDPGAAGSFAGEFTGSGYGRQIISSSMDATTLATGIAINNDLIVWGTPGENWGTLSHYGFGDAVSGGNMLFRQARETGLIINSGASPLQIGIGQLAIRAD